MFDWSTYCDIEIAENAFISSCKLPRMTHSNSGPIISETRCGCATANWTVRKSTKNSAELSFSTDRELQKKTYDVRSGSKIYLSVWNV